MEPEFPVPDIKAKAVLRVCVLRRHKSVHCTVYSVYMSVQCTAI